MRKSPRSKISLNKQSSNKKQEKQSLEKIQQTPQRKSTIKKRLSINHQNFVMCKIGSFDKDYNVIGKIGSGSFGSVYKVIHKTLNIQRALKIIKKSKNQLSSTLQQIQILKKLDHSNILKIYQFYQGQDSYFIITQIFQGKQLFDEIVDHDKLSQSLASRIVFQVLKAIVYTHSHKIAHRDLKPENIMVKNLDQKNMRIKIIDWGLGTLMGSEYSKRICGTPQYCAPQVLKGKYNYSCDMWSLGVITYLMQTGQMLFQGNNSRQTIAIVQKGVFRPNLQLFNKLSTDSKNFMKALLTRDPKKRLTAQQALQHPWIVNYNSGEKQQPSFLKQTLLRLKQFKVTNRLGVAVVSYVNNHMSSCDQKERLDQIFHYLDKNGDGVLSVQQLIQGYSKIYGKALGAKIAQETFQKLDLNENGSLDYSQFLAFGIKRQQEQQKIRLQQAFNLFDRNGDGKISWIQLGQVLGGKLQGFSQQQFKDIVKQIDKNGDNQIDLDQFLKCIDQVYIRIAKTKSKDSLLKSK